MPVSNDYNDYVLELLAPVEATSRRMFGGLGIFRDGLMFALVADDRLFFKTDESNLGEFQAAGAEPFAYGKSGKNKSVGYHEVPAEVIEDAEQLTDWARRSIDVAVRADAAKPPSARKAGRRRA